MRTVCIAAGFIATVIYNCCILIRWWVDLIAVCPNLLPLHCWCCAELKILRRFLSHFKNKKWFYQYLKSEFHHLYDKKIDHISFPPTSACFACYMNLPQNLLSHLRKLKEHKNKDTVKLVIKTTLQDCWSWQLIAQQMHKNISTIYTCTCTLGKWEHCLPTQGACILEMTTKTCFAVKFYKSYFIHKLIVTLPKLSENILLVYKSI